MNKTHLALGIIMLAIIITAVFSGNDSGEIAISNRFLTNTSEPGTAKEPTATELTAESTLTTQVSKPPNILLIVADDLGLDASAQYKLSNDLPETPTLNALADNGIVFDNAWATPSCTTTRASLITGLHGVNSGVDTVPGRLDPNANTLQRHLTNNTENYVSAVVGKWHIAGRNPELDHPSESGVPFYSGNMLAKLRSYFDWKITTNGKKGNSTTYHTTAITNTAVEWIAEQNTPWFMLLAYAAPHSPFHLPPGDLHDRNLEGSITAIKSNPRPYFLASIEAMDSEIGRLLDSLSEDERDNTLILFIGDNGTPRAVIDTHGFPRKHGKKSLYEGGIRVPMTVSGAGVTRVGEREEALVNTVDIYATIAEAAGAPIKTGINGISFLDMLKNDNAATREFNYSEIVDDEDSTGWTVRNMTHKLIVYANGTEELYDISKDLREQNNLIADGIGSNAKLVEILRSFGEAIRGQAIPGEEPISGKIGAIDITNVIFENTSPDCADYVNTYKADVEDLTRELGFEAEVMITSNASSCTMSSDNVPNHNFQEPGTNFATQLSEQSNTFIINRNPQITESPTPLTQDVITGVMLNGVFIDMLSAGCYNPTHPRADDDGDVRSGCGQNSAWLLDPLGSGKFATDSHNAHVQPDGSYHYHGNPNVIFDSNPGSKGSPLIGFAADGFPIYGSYFLDPKTKEVREALSGYTLLAGLRPSGEGNPGGKYDGRYEQDYEYTNAGDLDECNGMTVNGQYAYYVTKDFPWIIKCFSGTPNSSFEK